MADKIDKVLNYFLRIPVLMFDIPVFSFSRKISEYERQGIVDTLKEGDILLTADKLFPLWRFVVGLMGSPCYSHAAIYEGEKNIIEATTFHPSGCGVVRTPVNDFLSGRKNICVIRPSYRLQHKKNTMFIWLEGQLGKPYDYDFNCDNNQAMYCAKLVGKAMQVAGFSIDTRRFLHYRLYLPDFLMKIEEMNIVYRKCEKKSRQLLYCLPLILFIPTCLTNLTIASFLGALIFLLIIAAGWLQHLKLM